VIHLAKKLIYSSMTICYVIVLYLGSGIVRHEVFGL
jgi:hypothetical protein